MATAGDRPQPAVQSSILYSIFNVALVIGGLEVQDGCDVNSLPFQKFSSIHAFDS
jgi:hypothetical protein